MAGARAGRHPTARPAGATGPSTVGAHETKEPCLGELSLETATWLVSTAGRARVAAATRRLDEDDDGLRVGTTLRRDGLDAERATAVVAAAVARRRARERWSAADELLFTPAALEQASDPAVAAWRARRLAGERVWDLCAGVGGDTLALAAAGAEVTAVDRDAARLRLLAHNAEVLGLSVTTRTADALAVTPPGDALVHVDPSRRREGHRVKRLARHEPPVGAVLERHARAPGLAVVLSPAVPLDDPDLPDDAEIEFVADEHGLREAVAWRGCLRTAEALASATLLPGDHRVRTRPPPACPAGPIADHLVEAHPAAVRARLHHELAGEIGAHRVAERRALLTVAAPPPASRWYRVRPVEAVLPARAKEVRRWLRGADEAPVEVVLHGLDADPVAWWRALGRPPRGPNGRRLELVRTDDGARAVVTDARRGW